MKQNVSASAAVVVIVVAVALCFALFNKPAPLSPAEMAKPLPFSPSVDASRNADIRRALRPFGVLVVFPPVPEDRSRGVRLAAVVPGSPADRAGLKAGDLVTGFNGNQVASQDGLIYLLSQSDPRKSYPVEVVRSGKTRRLSVAGITPLPPEELAGFDFPRPAAQRPGDEDGEGPR